MFPGASLVFCGVNNYSDDLIEGQEEITGVAEEIDIRGTLDLALSLHPDTRRVAVVSDVIPSGRLHLQQVREVMDEYSNRVEFIELAELTAEQLVRSVRDLPPRTIVLHLSFFRDAKGRSYSPAESMKLVTSNTSAPVYTLWGWKIGLGAVGGVVTSGEMQGAKAAEMVRAILQGTPAGQIPVLRESPNVKMFDYREMARVGLSRGDLPPGAVVINEPHSFYREHRGLVWSVAASVAALLTLVALLSTNVLRRRRAERALEGQRDLLSRVLENIPSFVFWKDTQGVYQGCNRNFARLAGLDSPKDIVGMTDSDLPSRPKDVERYRFCDDSVIETGKPMLGIEETTTDAEGNQRLVITSKVPLRDKRGQVAGVLGLALDVTERRTLEQQLHQAQKMEAIGQLAGGVAHDFNNLLSAIQGNAELVRMSLPHEAPDRELIEEILRASRRASDLTQQLLGFSRRTQLDKVPLHVHRTIEEVTSLLSHSLDRKIEMSLDLQAGSDLILGDSSQLHNAILNLSVNARDAMPSGGRLTFRTANVTVADSPATPEDPEPGEYVELSVTDTGRGMDPQTVQRVFEPFFTTKEKGKGTGLGMAVVYGCVKSHEGAVTVDSEVGRGTVVRMLLPLACEQPGDEPLPLSEETAPLQTGQGNVLVVDDEKMVRTFASQALRGLGYRAETCIDGQDAVEHFQQHHPEIDLVLLDMIMPRLSGEETFRRLQQIDPSVRVIIMSGYSRNETIEQVLAEGALDFLPKPFALEDLSRIVGESIRLPTG